MACVDTQVFEMCNDTVKIYRLMYMRVLISDPPSGVQLQPRATTVLV